MKYFNNIVFYSFIFALLLLVGIFHFISSENTFSAGSVFDIPSDKLALKNARSSDGRAFSYWEIIQPSGKNNYIFLSSDLAGGNGFGGPLEIAVMTDASGNILDFKILKNNETPAFLQKALDDKKKYFQNNIFSPFDENKVIAVTGATYSSKGISKTLWLCGNKFASTVLGKKIHKPEIYSTPAKAAVKEKLMLCIFLLWAVALLFLRLRINRAARFAALIMTVIISGVVFQIQYSSESVISLLIFNLPDTFTTAFIIVLLVPLIVLLAGNYYCGYLCPFGALQEIINNLNFSGFNLSPDKKVLRYLRVIKYLVFVFLFSLFIFTAGNHKALEGDLLTGIFSLNLSNPFLAALIVGILLISLFAPRFWCGNLCPAGAFLSIFNKANILKLFSGRKVLMKYFPVSPGYCDLGVSGFNENDCINCDRCRINKIEKGKIIMEQKKENGASKTNIVYSVLAGIFLVLIIASSLYPFLKDKCLSAPSAANVIYKDGLYQGQAKGYSGNTLCEVKINGGKVSDIKIISSDDNAPGSAFTSIPAEIIKKQSTAVNAVTGATYSSRGVIGAVEQALAKASGKIKDEPKEKKDSAAFSKFTINPKNCKDGDYIGIGEGTRQITVSVSLKAGKITDIKIIDQQETMPGEALVDIIPQILEKQTLNDLIIPPYSSKTSRGLLEAVNMALMIAYEAGRLESDIDASLSSRVIKTIKLPPPERDGGMPLMKALNLRKSTRTFSSKPLSSQDISNMLWAAFGINRPDKGRTAPSDMNMQEIKIFLAMPEGLFIYDARANALLQISSEDIRKHTAYQNFAAEAPLDIIFAADLNAMKVIKSEQEKEPAAMVDTAFISQNVYLYCSSAGMNTVLLGWFDKKKLHSIMRLSDNFVLTYTQPVGYPPEKDMDKKRN